MTQDLSSWIEHDVAQPLSGEDDSDVSVSGLERYISRIRRDAVLTKEEERALLVRSFRGDAEAKEELILRNLRLVLKFARRIYSRRKTFSLSFDDFVQAGSIGIMDAVASFDPEQFDTRFSTYAVWHVEKRIWEAIYNEDRLIRFPVHMEKRIGKYLRAVSSCFRSLGRNPTAVEVAEMLGMSYGDILECASLFSGDFLSIDAAMATGDAEVFLADILPSEEAAHDERFLWVEAMPVLERALACLSPEDRTILFDQVGVFSERKSPERIGNERNIPQRDVTKRVYAAKAKVRRRLEQRGIRKRHFL